MSHPAHRDRPHVPRRPRRYGLPVLVLASLVALGGCATTIRIENRSPLELTDVKVAEVPFGDVAPGATTEYRQVRLRLGYATVWMRIAGHRVNAQTLNLRSLAPGTKPFTYGVGIKDLEAGHLSVEMTHEPPPAAEGSREAPP